MKVKCVDKGRSTILEVGKEYEVFEEVGDKYLVSTKLIGAVLYLKEYFELIKEDKMEEVRVVRKLKDLIGLTNGHGLEITKGHTEYMVCVGDLWTLLTYDCKIDLVMKHLKLMGFKFEYEPLRTIDQVKDEMLSKCKEFKFNGFNYYIKYIQQDKRYYVTYDCFNNILGALYFDEETANEYCNELNEILKNN